jgi:hypothetical protein
MLKVVKLPANSVLFLRKCDGRIRCSCSGADVLMISSYIFESTFEVGQQLICSFSRDMFGRITGKGHFTLRIALSLVDMILMNVECVTLYKWLCSY